LTIGIIINYYSLDLVLINITISTTTNIIIFISFISIGFVNHY